MFSFTTLLVLHGCSLEGPMTQRPAHAQSISRKGLSFSNSDTERRFDALAAHVAATTTGWRLRELRLVGNFVTQRWCSPDLPESICDGGAAPRDTGAWISLSTLHHPGDWPQVFGLVYQGWSMPDEHGRVMVRLAEDTGSVTNDELSILVQSEDATLDLGTLVSHEVHDTTFSVRINKAPHALAREVLASPEALRAHGEQQLDALLAEVERGINAGEARKAVFGEYKGGGIPPEKTRVPLSEAEQAEALSQARAAIAADKARWKALAGWVHTEAAALLPPDALQ